MQGLSPTVTRRAVDRRLIVTIASMAMLASAIYGWVHGNPANSAWSSALQGVVNAFLAAVPIVWLETSGMRGRLGRALRRLPFIAFVLLKTLIYLCVIVPSIEITRRVFSAFSVQHVGFDENFFEILVFAGSLSLATNVLLSLGALLGWAMLWRLATGRYHRPRREERIFLSIDLRGSTALAEQLGDVRFHALLNAFFSDVTDGATEVEAEIYKYVGDEVILTWLPARGLANANCLMCPIAIHRHIIHNRAHYTRRFGCVPEFRAALHIGEVIAGEVGDLRREIGYFGDTLNTTARLSGAAKDLGVDVVISRALLDRLHAPPGIEIRPLAPLPMRGKSAPLAIATFGLPGGLAGELPS